jgi:hypothetical protein
VGYQLYQLVKNYRHFRNYLCPHHQGLMSVIFNQLTQMIGEADFINFSHHESFRSYINFYLFVRSNVLVSHLLHNKMKLCYCNYIQVGSLVPFYLLQPPTHFWAVPVAISIFKSTQHARVSGKFYSNFPCSSCNMFGRARSERYFVEHIPLYRKPAFFIAKMPRKK